MSTTERVRSLIEPLVADQGLDLYDLELNGGSLRVAVDQPGGVGMDAIAELTRAISRALDEHDPISGHFTLEVSSPGLERQLRTPAHFRGAVDTAVTVKTVAGFAAGRRVAGVLRQADDDAIVVETSGGDLVTIGHGDIERARTVFEWGPAPKPGKAPRDKGPKSTSAEKAPSSPAATSAPASGSDGAASSPSPAPAARAARPGASASPNEKVPAS
jgi:ribosome maturation factor RimP